MGLGSGTREVTWLRKMARFVLSVLLLVFSLPTLLHGIETESRLKVQVLHNWEGIYDASEKHFPQQHLADVILQTFGLPKDTLWKGATVGNVFNRPKASVLIAVDGELSMEPLDSKVVATYEGVGPARSIEDVVAVDSVSLVSSMDKVFEGESFSTILSAKTKNSHVNKNMKSVSLIVKSEDLSKLTEYVNKNFCPEFVCMKEDGSFTLSSDKGVTFDSANEFEGDLLRELLMALALPGDINPALIEDSYPDVFVVSLTGVKMLAKYSPKAKVVMEMYTKIIEKLSKEFISMYDGRLLVQVVTVESKPTPTDSPQAETVYKVRHRRSSQGDAFAEDQGNLRQPGDAKNLVGDRTENFSAMATIITFVTVVLILAVFSVSWILYSTDPAKDTIIYRLVPTRAKTE